MGQPLLKRIENMQIRTRLLLLMLLFGFTVLVNCLALLFLARFMSASFDTIENARAHQVLASNMQLELRNAEAALYRYQLEGSSGFAAQFDFESASFGRDVETYRSLALTTNESAWANELARVRGDVQNLGNELIHLHDEQASNLRSTIATEARLSHTFSQLLQSPQPAGTDYTNAVDGMADGAQEIYLAVTGYLATPDGATLNQLTEGARGFRQHLDEFRRLTAKDQQTGDVKQIEAAFQELQTLSAELASSRDQQQLSFARFSAEVFEAEQFVIAEQVQPLENRRLREAQQNLRTALLVAVAVGLMVPIGLTIAAALVGLRLARTMDRSIFALLRGADRVVAGDLDHPVQVSTTDELRRLAEAFNNMMTDLAVRERRLKARLVELETLRGVSLQITSTLDLDQVLASIASSAQSLVDASIVRIHTRDEMNGELRLAADTGQEVPASPKVDGLVAEVATSGQPHVISIDDCLASPDSRPTAAFPLRLGEVLGVLSVSSTTQQAFMPEDIRILGLLADQAAVALGNARLYRNLAAREEHVRSLMEKMARIQDEERRLIGLDLHDGLTQLVISANMHLNALSSMLATMVDARTQQELEESRTLIRRAIEEARRVIAELRPTAIDDFGLAEGLRRYVMEVSESNDWRCDIHVDPDAVAMSLPAQTAIFRICQEALSNARKYSRTRKLKVELKLNHSDLILQVRDWGVGFDPAALSEESDSLGLTSMQERARMLGGTCEITSRPGQGTVVLVRAPLTALRGGANEQR